MLKQHRNYFASLATANSFQSDSGLLDEPQVVPVDVVQVLQVRGPLPEVVVGVVGHERVGPQPVELMVCPSSLSAEAEPPPLVLGV